MAGIDVLQKRYCREYIDGTVECFQDDGFWYSTVRSLLFSPR